MTPASHPLNCETITRTRLIELLKIFDRNVIDAPNATICPYCGDIYFLGKVICGKSIHSASSDVLDVFLHMSSGDLLLLAHDEWKRREERKHIHEESGWVSGWIGGFMTSKKWAREYVKKLRQQKEREP